MTGPSGATRLPARPHAGARAPLRLALRFLCGIVLSGPPLAAGQAQNLDLTIGHTGREGSLLALTAAEFAARVERSLSDEARLTVIAPDEGSSQQDHLRELKLGRLDFALPTTALSSVVPEFAALDLPYLIKDRAHMIRIEEKVIRPVLAPLLAPRGFHLLAVWEDGLFHLDSGSKAVLAPHDLAGLSIAVDHARGRYGLFQSLGARPVVVLGDKRTEALAHGVIEGGEGTLSDLLLIPRARGPRNLSLTGHAYQPAFLVAAKARFDRWPPDFRRRISLLAADMQPFVHRRGAELELDSKAELAGRAIEVHDVSPDRFATMGRAFESRLVAALPAAQSLIEQIRALQ